MVIGGSSLADAIRARSDFTPMLPRILAIGESSGRLDEVLGEAAEYYEEQLDQAISRMSALVESVMLIVVGGLSDSFTSHFLWHCSRLPVETTF